ncbi:uncharacterized protein PAC_17597 [Phialocephala subalpina]|uniref:2EXR domain-containing protein n=1 Tax=Phialocephala subalpina TaxID=576137 RepID=A0A1L7XRV3_9HELO|nr:uncharacterized protein PAC_17597 [Phialocephala subalpina]
MDTFPLTFEPFTRFPKELRLQVWKCILPEPRIIDVEIIEKKGERLRRPTSLQPASGTGSAPRHNNFAAAANVLYRASFRFDPLFEENVAKDFDSRLTSWWVQKTEMLGVHLTFIKANFLGVIDSNMDGFKCFNEASGRAHAVPCLLTLIETSRRLKQILIVIDGRDARFSGPVEIIEPLPGSVEFREADGYLFALKAISLIVADLKAQRPDLSSPEIKLALLTNGEGTVTLKNGQHAETLK